MKKLYLVTLLASVTNITGCKSVPKIDLSPKVILQAELPVSTRQKVESENTYYVRKGDRLEFTYSHNSSLGETMSPAIIGDMNIIRPLPQKVIPDCPSGMVGCGVTVTLKFKAVQRGVTDISIEKGYRGKLVARHTFNIHVR